MRFNNENCEKLYKKIQQEAITNGFTEEDVKHPNLSKLNKQTKSPRIMKMISLAFQLGKMNGVKEYDELFYSKARPFK